MDADNEYEIKKARDAVHMIQTIQSMIDVSADRLEGLRTQCSTSAELTQQEIRTLEGKLVKHFSRQLVIKARFGEELMRVGGGAGAGIPCVRQWLRVVGLSADAIKTVAARVGTLEALQERSDRELRALVPGARDEEVRRLCGAMQRLRTYVDALNRGEGGADIQLYWDSWERHGHGHVRGSPRPPRAARVPRGSLPGAEEGSPLGEVARTGGISPTTPISNRKQNCHLPAPVAAAAALTKSRSHESQLSARPDASDHSDNSQSSTAGTTEGTPPTSPHEPPPAPASALVSDVTHQVYHNNINAPRSPRTPVTRSMAHDIAHRFTKNFNMIATCDYCDKQMLFGTGLKCKECKYKCHRDCESKVTPSCGLPYEFVVAFKEQYGYGSPAPSVAVRGAAAGLLSSLTHRQRARTRRPAPPPHHAHPIGGGGACPDSSSNTSSCNSSTPSSPALPAHPPPHLSHAPPPHPSLHDSHAAAPASPALVAAPILPAPTSQQFHFPEVKAALRGVENPLGGQSPARAPAPVTHVTDTSPASDELTSSANVQSVSVTGSCGGGSEDSGGVGGEDSGGGGGGGGDEDGAGGGTRGNGATRTNSLELSAESGGPGRWPRQNSLSMKEWDIPYDELKLFEVIGTGRFGTVYRGSWHGAVAVKLLHVQALGDHAVPLDTFKYEVATFRKTRHENLVLFMGACMKPPRLAIVTSLCKGMTLYTHIHLRKDKFNANKSVIVAQQISQGMGYLHARGIIHKDLKTKNIFLENGKVVITDFGLFSVTKLCFSNNARGDSLGIPPGWLCYLAPEMVRALRPHASLHLPFSKATDVYAFGTVWYELLCGEHPFRAQPAEAVIWQVGRGVKQSLGHLHASRDIKDLLMLCWAHRASDRPDFAHLLATLEKLPRKRLARSPSHPVHLSRSADSVF